MIRDAVHMQGSTLNMIVSVMYWPKPYLLLSATCDKILLWMIGIWMENHVVSDSNCNTVKSIISPKF